MADVMLTHSVSSNTFIAQLRLCFKGFELLHVDEFIDEILREDRVCDVILPRIQVPIQCHMFIAYKFIRLILAAR